MTIDVQAATASDFVGFRCWTPESADQTISIEAVTASPAVFLATHGPLLIARTPVRVEEHADRADFDIVSEADVLKDFAQRRPVNGVLIMPVVGQSGTGKSHLVRWIREHLPERKDRRVVYIEKTNTNLSGVVNALLMGLEGEEFDVIREEVGKVVTDYDERRLPGELLAQLALSIEFSEVDESRPDARYRRGLVGQGRLSALLLDHVMYSRLVAPDGVVSRLAKELQHGRARGEAERRFGFEVDDFPTDLAEIGNAGASAKNLMQQLVASDALLATAVQLLNENLDQAVLRLANLTGGKLQHAMLDIRRALHKQGQEIVLLVEDFAVIQGVQRDLLDAITEVGVREGRAELAPIRTLMAVTRGYFDALAETVTTRAAAGIPYLYDLDVSVGDARSQVSSEHIQDFAARYLNAARLGQAALEGARAGSAGGEGEDWVPNACERCPFQFECHAAFGRSSDGYGLYPLNNQVLGRAVRSRSSSDVFNPRAVLGRVLRPVLESYYEDIPSGKFPPPAFARAFPLSPRDRPLLAEVVESLHLNDPKDHDRRVVLLEYWGGAPVQPGNLKEGIHRAFKLPPIDTFDVVAPRVDVEGQDQTPSGALPVRLIRARTALENWFGRNEVLPQEVARQLRGLISDAVLKRISWNDLLLAEPSKEELRIVLRDKNATGVRIEGAAGEGGQQAPGPANIRIDRNATTATLLGALLTREHLGHWNFPGGPVQARRFQSLTDAWGARVVSGVRALRGVDNDATTSSAVAVSLLGALVLGIDGARSRDQADLMRALLDEGDSLTTLGDAEVRPRQWNDLASRVLAARPALVKHLRGVGGAAQGGGQVQLIDVDRLLVHVKATGADLELVDVPDEAPPWLIEASRPLRERMDAAVRAQLSMLQAWADEVLPSFGGASTAPEVLSALEQALEEAVQMGVFTGGRGGMAADQQELLRKARKYAWSTLEDVRVGLGRSEDDKMIRLKEAAADRGRSFGPIQQFAATSHAWLDGTSARAATRLRDEAPEGGLALVEVLSGVERVIQQLQASAAGTPAAGTGPHAAPNAYPTTESSS